MTDETRLYEVFSLDSVIAEFPPDPESEAKRRAEILVKSDTLRVVLITALNGSVLKEHNSPGPITIQVVQGSFDLKFDDDVRSMSEGDIAIVAPGVMHEVECTGDGAFLLTIAHLSYVPDAGGEE